ncbi:Tad domain-containing protein [Acidicapsa dinghuensis]|uniref:Tad domain-containing protein n=1 Tax=Acidicapsa dinghuensis TaxID=2218256 RepID=A0ABW1ECZ0_9BACT|nr:Tad domain-containing protein [Acidicapsa dinghuensis]
MRLLRDENGQALIVVALSMVLLLAFAAIAVDVGRLLYIQRQLQTAADAAAVAGAIELQQCGTTANCSTMQTAAKSALAENNLSVSSSNLLTQCATGSTTQLTLTVNNGPCALGASDPNHGNTKYVEAVVAEPVITLFAGILSVKSFNISARSEAGLGDPTDCVYVLNPTATDALLVNGNSTLTAQCGIIVDSNANTAALFNGHPTVSASEIDVAGGAVSNGNPSVSPTPTTGDPPQSDPLAGLPAPQVGACGATTSSPFTGSPSSGATVNGNGSAVFNPGTYCGTVTLNGSSTATFNPGTYIFTGNFQVNGNNTLTGTGGVTFYFSSTAGSFTVNGNSHVDLVAPTSGTYEGILLYQNASDTNTDIINGDNTSVWQGTIYLPGAQLTVNGNGNAAAYTFLVVNKLLDNGNSTFTLGDDYSSLQDGPPVKGKAHLTE